MNNYFTAAKEEQADINLTPMLDVVFILLIFFVVTASFTKDLGIPTGLTINLEVPVVPAESIVVVVEPDDSFHVNGRVLAKLSLVPYIRGLKIENPNASILLLAARDAHVEATVAALDAGRQAGFGIIPIEELH